MRKGFWTAWVLMLFLAVSGCEKPEKTTAPSADRGKISRFLLDKAPDKYDVKAGLVLDGKIEILGLDYNPKPIQHGKPYTVTFYFKALQPIPDDYEFFGHFEPVGKMRFRAKMDHHVLNGRYRTNQWQKGDIIKDVFRSRMPKAFPGTRGILWGGFYKGETRLPVDAKSREHADGEGRLKIAEFDLDTPEEIKKVATAYRAETPIKIDGKLDESAWKNAGGSGIFVDLTGDHKPTPATEAKFLWDDKNLYIAFFCHDTDIWTNYSKRDDPLYKEETTEVMIDADGSGSTYYEIQVNAVNAVYDAYFPARRKDMDISWDGKVRSAVSMDGTVNKREDRDKHWIVEMAIPLASIADAPNTPPKEGDQWRLNLYRMERPAKRGVTASMWSPVFVGDFHTLDRFGTLIFSTKHPEERGQIRKAGPTVRKADQKPPVLQRKPDGK